MMPENSDDRCATMAGDHASSPSSQGVEPVPYSTLNPPEGITPAQTREPYSWSFPQYKDAPPDLPGRLPRQSWTPQERKTYEARVKWFHEAKYGIFFHYLSGGAWTPEEWNRWVDAVDVEKVADQAKAVGAGYVILTLGQNHIYSCAPNPIIDELWKSELGPFTSRRDLPMDLWKALDRRGIPLMLYLASDNQHKMPQPPAMTYADRFEGWKKVAQWYSSHYGARCKGWWLDGLGEFIPDYRVNIRQALKDGNPDTIVACDYEVSDFTHGHCMENWARQSKVVKPFYGRWDPDFNIQWHVFQFIGPTWGAPGCNKKPEDLVRYAVDVVRGGGVFTFDLGTFTEGCFHQLPADIPTGRKPDGSRIGPFLEIQPDQFAILEAVRDAVKDIPPSDGRRGGRCNMEKQACR
ncbi:MAG: hypothetical protein R6X19_06340 [Kiritimatiellia bacterium]